MYDSLRATYIQALAEIKKRELEIAQLESMLLTEQAENTLVSSTVKRKDAIIAKQKQLYDKAVRRAGRRFVVGPHVGYGIGTNAATPSIGVALVYKVFSF